MAASLTTHVLDTTQGCAASNMVIEVWSLEPESGNKKLLKKVCTNANGRTDRPLLSEGELAIGVYELVFAVGDYFAQKSDAIATPPFLDRVPVQFGIADPTAHYHVPLLASPWAYSTYRGS